MKAKLSVCLCNQADGKSKSKALNFKVNLEVIIVLAEIQLTEILFIKNRVFWQLVSQHFERKNHK